MDHFLLFSEDELSLSWSVVSQPFPYNFFFKCVFSKEQWQTFHLKNCVTHTVLQTLFFKREIPCRPWKCPVEAWGTLLLSSPGLLLFSFLFLILPCHWFSECFSLYYLYRYIEAKQRDLLWNTQNQLLQKSPLNLGRILWRIWLCLETIQSSYDNLMFQGQDFVHIPNLWHYPRSLSHVKRKL